MQSEAANPFKKRATIAFGTAVLLFVISIPFVVFIGGGQALIAADSGRKSNMIFGIIFQMSFLAAFILSITNLLLYLWKKFDLSFYVSIITIISSGVCFFCGIVILFSLL